VERYTAQFEGHASFKCALRNTVYLY